MIRLEMVRNQIRDGPGARLQMDRNQITDGQEPDYRWTGTRLQMEMIDGWEPE